MSFHSVDEFNVQKVLGSGGFGRALLTECLNDLAEYVLKEVNLTKIAEQYADDPSFAAKCIEMSRKEHEKVKQHPNIVRVYGSFEEMRLTRDPDFLEPRICHFYYLVMEYCEGGDLESLIREARRKNEPFSESQINIWMKHLTSALKHLHNHNILHRDIKPKNVFVTSNRTLKLGDFGTAKTVSVGNATTTTAIATWQYASPEVCRTGEFSEKSDIWSLGVLIYEIVNLKRPFVDGPKRFQAICAEKPEPFYYKHYSSELQTFILAMLEKDPTRRPNIDQIFNSSFLRTRSHTMTSTPSSNVLDRRGALTPPSSFPKIPLQLLTLIGSAPGTPATSPRNSRKNAPAGLPRPITPQLIEMARELLTATESNDLAKIRLILGSDTGRKLLTNQSIWSAPPAPLELLTSHGDSPLHRAARFNRLEAARVLVVEFDCPLEMQNARSNFAIHTAIGAGHLGIVEFFLDRQPSLLEAKGRYDRTPLIQAVLSNNLQIAKHLLNTRSANVKARTSQDDHKSMAIHYAAAYGFLEAMSILLDYQPDLIEAKDANFDTPLNRAASTGRLDAVQFLVKKRGASVENRDNQGRTPFLQAAVFGHLNVASYLVREAGADVNATDTSRTHDSAVHLASCFGHLNIVEYLLGKFPGMINARNICNDIAMNLAATGGRLFVVSYLLSKAVTPGSKIALLENQGEHSYTPLMQAASNNNLDVVKSLVENGANLQAAEPKQGNTAIHLAAHFGCLEVVRYLACLSYRSGHASAGTAVVPLMNSKNAKGQTPLSIAKNANHKEIVQFLLQAGAK